MTIAMSEQVDAEPCDVLRGGDGPVYFLLGGQLYVVHEVLGRWIEADQDAARPVFESAAAEAERGRNGGAGAGPAGSPTARPPSARPVPDRRVPDRRSSDQPSSDRSRSDPSAADRAVSDNVPADASYAPSGEPRMADPPMVEHWLVTASVGRFGRPAVFRLQRRPAPPAKGPDTWTVRAERR